MCRTNSFRFLVLLFALIILWFPLAADEPSIIVGKFSEGELVGWSEKIFEGKTSYELISQNGKTVIKAVSNQAASGFYKSIRVNLNKTPYLNWSWKIEKTLDVKDEKQKSGDDFPARIYLVFKTGSWSWNINSLNYVWSSVSPVESDWPNPFLESVRMIAVVSGEDQAGKWKIEKRNVKQDYFRCFNKDVEYVDAVAIMTDTDNSKSTAVAYYGDIYFSAN